MLPPAVVVHSLAEADAALAAAEEAGRAVTLIGAPGAMGYAGPMFFAALAAAAAERHPAAVFDAMFDCAESAGDALAALRVGAKRVCFTGEARVAAKLAEIATQLGAEVETARPPALDPRGKRDPIGACRAWIESGADG